MNNTWEIYVLLKFNCKIRMGNNCFGKNDHHKHAPKPLLLDTTLPEDKADRLPEPMQLASGGAVSGSGAHGKLKTTTQGSKKSKKTSSSVTTATADQKVRNPTTPPGSKTGSEPGTAPGSPPGSPESPPTDKSGSDAAEKEAGSADAPAEGDAAADAAADAPKPGVATKAKETAVGGKLVIVKFYEDDCDDCNKVTKVYEAMVDRFSKVLFLEANVVDNVDAAVELNVRMLPTFVAFKDGEEVGRLVDCKPQNIETFVRRHL